MKIKVILDNILRVIIWISITINAIFVYMAMNSGTCSPIWSDMYKRVLSQRDLRALTGASNIAFDIVATHMEGDDVNPVIERLKQTTDPWGNYYHIRIAYTNAINIGNLNTITIDSVIVWSSGKNRENEFGRGDDLVFVVKCRKK